MIPIYESVVCPASRERNQNVLIFEFYIYCTEKERVLHTFVHA